MSMNSKWLLVGVTALVLGAGSARADGPVLKELLSGDSAPLTMKLKDLRPDWRRISITGLPEASGGGGGGLAQLAGGIFGALFGGGGARLRWRRRPPFT